LHEVSGALPKRMADIVRSGPLDRRRENGANPGERERDLTGRRLDRPIERRHDRQDV
jgi:hypothetical protein